ncbi:unnamed protein product [Cladocopium goreaui]|uniref:non-specific serine/threonine protein kinase n=1 Tax=Cladocopium goreaui TaxID=2562237 RepID=A0A9P1GC05_9DINO|nr:unnamed protein product [Cladocopium goreaui]
MAAAPALIPSTRQPCSLLCPAHWHCWLGPFHDWSGLDHTFFAQCFAQFDAPTWNAPKRICVGDARGPLIPWQELEACGRMDDITQMWNATSSRQSQQSWMPRRCLHLRRLKFTLRLRSLLLFAPFLQANIAVPESESLMAPGLRTFPPAQPDADGHDSREKRMAMAKCFALKEVPIGYLGAAEQRRVLEELRLHKAFDCPFVVRYFTSWMQDDTACLLLEYVENGSLAAEVQRCRREDRQISDACIIDWASQIILGLLYLHRKEVVHRDLKMENLLGPSLEGCVKIADFGISKRLSGASLARSLVGTLEVMAPERVKALASEGVGSAPSEYGPESDLWSLGVVLYELALLHAPFSEDRADLSAQERQRRLIDRIQHDKPSPLPFSRAAVLHKVVIGGLLQKQPSQRPSAAELCQDPDLGRSIHHFLQKQKLLDHPSILEILDVLPSVEDPEGSFLASSLDVVTLRSHRSSLGGTGPFLDGARLSATELRKLLPEDLAEVFETAEAVDNSDSVPEPGQRLERKASKGPMAPGRSASHPVCSNGPLQPIGQPGGRRPFLNNFNSKFPPATTVSGHTGSRAMGAFTKLGHCASGLCGSRTAERSRERRRSAALAAAQPAQPAPEVVERHQQQIFLYLLLELLQRLGLPILNSARFWALMSVLCFSAWYSVEPKSRPQKWTPPKDAAELEAPESSLEEFLDSLAQQLNERSPPTEIHSLKADGWKDISTRGAQIFMKMLKVPRMVTQIYINVNSSDQEKYFPWVLMDGNTIKGGAIPIFLALDHWPSWFPFCQLASCSSKSILIHAAQSRRATSSF